jgi:hypothetical protein
LCSSIFDVKGSANAGVKIRITKAYTNSRGEWLTRGIPRRGIDVIRRGDPWRFASPRAIALRSDFTASQLRGLARRAKDTAQAGRLLALAVICDGASRGEAARLGNVTVQIVRDWVVRFNAEGPEGSRERHTANDRESKRLSLNACGTWVG